MNAGARIRQLHRWLSIIFTLAVLANIAAIVTRQPATWIGLLAFVPLIPLMATGLYMFLQPHLKRRGEQAAEARA